MKALPAAEPVTTPSEPGVIANDGEQSRARYPDREGYVTRDGQRVFYEVYGEGDETIFFLPTWSIVHSRIWKMQIPYFARHFRVIAMDGLGNGRSDRCREQERYSAEAFAEDCLAVMDESGTDRAVFVGLSRGTQWLLELASKHPERVAGAVVLGAMFPYTLSHFTLLLHPAAEGAFHRPMPAYRWWGRMNANHWRENYREFLEWFQERCLPEPHSTKGFDDAVEWGLDTDPETLITSAQGDLHRDRGTLRELAGKLSCPTLVLHGGQDKIAPLRDGKALARATIS